MLPWNLTVAVDIDNAIDVIKQLKPRKFNFNRSAYSHDVKYARANTISGFIADEVLSVASQYVNIIAEDVDGKKVENPISVEIASGNHRNQFVFEGPGVPGGGF